MIPTTALKPHITPNGIVVMYSPNDASGHTRACDVLAGAILATKRQALSAEYIDLPSKLSREDPLAMRGYVAAHWK